MSDIGQHFIASDQNVKIHFSFHITEENIDLHYGPVLHLEPIKHNNSLQYHPEAPFSCAVCSTAHLFPPMTGLQVLENGEKGKWKSMCERGEAGIWGHIKLIHRPTRQSEEFEFCIPAQWIHSSTYFSWPQLIHSFVFLLFFSLLHVILHSCFSTFIFCFEWALCMRSCTCTLTKGDISHNNTS